MSASEARAILQSIDKRAEEQGLKGDAKAAFVTAQKKQAKLELAARAAMDDDVGSDGTRSTKRSRNSDKLADIAVEHSAGPLHPFQFHGPLNYWGDNCSLEVVDGAVSMKCCSKRTLMMDYPQDPSRDITSPGVMSLLLGDDRAEGRGERDDLRYCRNDWENCISPFERQQRENFMKAHDIKDVHDLDADIKPVYEY